MYLEGPENVEQLRRIGHEFRGTPLAVSILEGGGKTPFIPPADMHKIGFNMLLYPTTLIFRQTRAIQRALADLKQRKPMPKDDSVSMLEFEKIVDIVYWKSIEQSAVPLGERVRQALNKVTKKVA